MQHSGLAGGSEALGQEPIWQKLQGGTSLLWNVLFLHEISQDVRQPRGGGPQGECALGRGEEDVTWEVWSLLLSRQNPQDLEREACRLCASKDTLL